MRKVVTLRFKFFSATWANADDNQTSDAAQAAGGGAAALALEKTKNQSLSVLERAQPGLLAQQAEARNLFSKTVSTYAESTLVAPKALAGKLLLGKPKGYLVEDQYYLNDKTQSLWQETKAATKGFNEDKLVAIGKLDAQTAALYKSAIVWDVARPFLELGSVVYMVDKAAPLLKGTQVPGAIPAIGATDAKAEGQTAAVSKAFLSQVTGSAAGAASASAVAAKPAD
jgi:hypothetical protein